MNGNLITVIVVVASSILSFLLGQPTGTFDPSVVLVLGALNVGLTALARFLPSQGQPVQVEVASPVVTVTPDAGTTPAPTDV